MAGNIAILKMRYAGQNFVERPLNYQREVTEFFPSSLYKMNISSLYRTCTSEAYLLRLKRIQAQF